MGGPPCRLCCGPGFVFDGKSIGGGGDSASPKWNRSGVCNIIGYTAFCFIPHRGLQLLVFGSTLPPSLLVMYDWVIARYGQLAPQPSRLQHLMKQLPLCISLPSPTSALLPPFPLHPPQHSLPFLKYTNSLLKPSPLLTHSPPR